MIDNFLEGYKFEVINFVVKRLEFICLNNVSIVIRYLIYWGKKVFLENLRLLLRRRFFFLFLRSVFIYVVINLRFRKDFFNFI